MCSTTGDSIERLLADADLDGLLDAAERALRRAALLPLSGAVYDVALTRLVQRLTALERIAAGHRATVVREIAGRQAHRGQSAATTTDLLARTLHLWQGEARARTELAEGLAVLPDTAAALADGRIGESQARVAIQKAAEVKDRADGELLVEQIDQVAATVGQQVDRNRLAREIDTQLAKSDVDVLAERELTAFTRRSLTWTTRDGMHVLHAELDAIGGTRVRAMLDSLSDKTDERDTRTFPQRQADALVHMADLAEQAQDRPHTTLQAGRPAGPLSGGAALRLSQGTRLPRCRSVGTLRSPSSGNRRAGPATVPPARVAWRVQGRAGREPDEGHAASPHPNLAASARAPRRVSTATSARMVPRRGPPALRDRPTAGNATPTSTNTAGRSQKTQRAATAPHHPDHP